MQVRLASQQGKGTCKKKTVTATLGLFLSEIKGHKNF